MRGRNALSVLALVPTLAAAAAVQPLQALREAAEAHARAAAAGAAPRVEVRAGTLDPRLRLPRCGTALETFDPPGARPIGRRVVGVRCPGPRPWSVYVPVVVRGLIPVVVAARPLARGTRLGTADLRLAERDVGTLPAGYVRDPARVLGQELTRPLRPGEVVSPRAVRPPRVVRRGERVVLVAEAPGIQVRMSGRALGDGAVGQRVQVRNERSGRTVEGIVIGPGRVRVPM